MLIAIFAVQMIFFWCAVQTFWCAVQFFWFAVQFFWFAGRKNLSAQYKLLLQVCHLMV
jgi:hypothetical protein